VGAENQRPEVFLPDVMTRAEHVFAAFNDLRPLGRTLNDADAMTLFTHLRDEMYFLPAFLDHYRRLGIERFVLVDDRSEDGGREYLLDQPDVMVLGTDWRFGESAPIAPGHLKVKSERAITGWLNILPARYALGRWAVRADLDEFVTLPSGTTFADVAALAETAGGNVVYGPMLDLYPSKLGDAIPGDRFDPETNWFFDALPHLRPSGARQPKQIYHGARARLLLANDIWPHPAVRVLLHLARVSRPPFFNDLRKPVLFRWQSTTLQASSHEIDLVAVPGFLLPVPHYKFAEDLRRRVCRAVSERQYFSASFEYTMLERLLDELEKAEASLTFKHSRPVRGFDGFAASGNGFLPL